MKILGIDTSGKVASCALMNNGILMGEKTVVTRLTHSQVILPMVKNLLEDLETPINEIDCVAIANGPGSYTGLRIGIGAVKGMCFGNESMKCAGISTLEALAYNHTCFDGEIYTVMKARPDIVYFGGFECKGSKITRIHEDIVCPEEQAVQIINESAKPCLLAGDMSMQFKYDYLKDKENVRISPANENLQRASALCMAVSSNPQYIISADKLDAAYLQATKAEKDKFHR